VKRCLKTEKLFSELEEVAHRLFTEVRHEQGRFQTGVCRLRGKRVLIVNKHQALDERIAALASEIARMGMDKLYLKPAIREEIERYNNKVF